MGTARPDFETKYVGLGLLSHRETGGGDGRTGPARKIKVGSGFLKTLNSQELA